MAPAKDKTAPPTPEPEDTKAAPPPQVEVTPELRGKAYSAGQKRLREENRDEFKRLVQEEAAKLGFTYEFQPTAEEKAEAEAAALFAAHPGLKEKLLAEGK